jgi:hypothetical protein
LRSYARSDRLWQTADAVRTLIHAAPLHPLNEPSCPRSLDAIAARLSARLALRTSDACLADARGFVTAENMNLLLKRRLPRPMQRRPSAPNATQHLPLFERPFNRPQTHSSRRSIPGRLPTLRYCRSRKPGSTPNASAQTLTAHGIRSVTGCDTFGTARR